MDFLKIYLSLILEGITTSLKHKLISKIVYKYQPAKNKAALIQKFCLIYRKKNSSIREHLVQYAIAVKI